LAEKRKPKDRPDITAMLFGLVPQNLDRFGLSGSTMLSKAGSVKAASNRGL
jgi:hypothetical protein